MKYYLACAAGFALLLSHWANADQLIGNWELEYAIYKNQKGEVVGEIKDQDTRSRKILSDQHFAFITWDKNGKFIVAASGTYSFKGDAYTETIDVTSEARLMGKTYHFNAAINNDLWIHKGMEDDIFIEEHWRRTR